jgi:hypothetical protein
MHAADSHRMTGNLDTHSLMAIEEALEWVRSVTPEILDFFHVSSGEDRGAVCGISLRMVDRRVSL